LVYEPQPWLLFIYNLPAAPSRTRVYVWRKLKQAGAINYQQSVWLLPDTAETHALFAALAKEIAEAGGTSSVMKGSTQNEADEKRITEEFTAARNSEYEEIMERCEDFWAEIEKETKRQNFNYAEVEENEVELAKLQKWFDLVKTRDFTGTEKQAAVVAMLAKCEQLLREFSDRVFSIENKN